MEKHKHFGVYGLIIENDKIVLIKKRTGPYDGKLDLPGGSIEFSERPNDTLKRELFEEVGIELEECELVDCDSVCFDFMYDGKLLKWQHIGIFYRILSYKNDIRKDIEIDSRNDDSLGADFYDINNLKKEEVSDIVALELRKLGYWVK